METVSIFGNISLQVSKRGAIAKLGCVASEELRDPIGSHQIPRDPRDPQGCFYGRRWFYPSPLLSGGRVYLD